MAAGPKLRDLVFLCYYQGRMVRKVSAEVLAQFAASGSIGRKYLIHHSAGSGKTLSIGWLADRLHSIFKADTTEKLTDLIFRSIFCPSP